MPLFLREVEVKALLTMDVTLAALEAAFREWGAGRAANQPRRRVSAGAALAVMSAALPSGGLMGFKAYSMSKAGTRFWVALFDAADGRPRALMEADWLGRMRTGAASGLATKFLARPESGVLSIIGSGSQALTQVLAVAAVRPIREVLIYSRDAAHRAAFVDELGGALAEGIRIRAMASMREAVEGADILTTITSAAQPLFPGEWLQAGQHLNVCGSNFPDRREVDGRTVARADLVVADDAEAARLEAGDLLLAEREGQLGWGRVHSLREVVAGATGHRQPSDVTLFKSVGLAIEDVAAGGAVLQMAEARGIGLHLPD
ncbi:MAG TPA: ornithine cyclodeaminase family protein [Candidatus Dormibacteraeota bacterium]|nr:ornithine cyclodeaminase family protein [Candidatus Dormibacteraeota bacterium]